MNNENFKINSEVETPLGSGVIKIIEGLTISHRKFWVELDGGALGGYKYINLDNTDNTLTLNIVDEKDCKLVK